jgi:hypothetical protein
MQEMVKRQNINERALDAVVDEVVETTLAEITA